MDNLFDGGFNGAARSEMYRAAFAPDLFPHEKPFRIMNWSEDEREEFCGIYSPARQRELESVEDEGKKGLVVQL